MYFTDAMTTTENSSNGNGMRTEDPDMLGLNMSFTFATPTEEPINISLNQKPVDEIWTTDSVTSNVNTKSTDGMAIFNGNRSFTGEGATHVTEIARLTSKTGIMNGTHDNDTIQSSTGVSASTGLTVGVTVPLVVIIAVVAIILICVYRKRRSGPGKVRVWHIPRTQSIQAKERTTWHEEDQEEGEEDNRGFNPDLELQPTNIFTHQDIFIKHEEDFAAENEQSINRNSKDRETIVFNPENETFKLSDDLCDKKDEDLYIDLDDETSEVKLVSDKTVARNHLDATDDSAVTKDIKKFQIAENTKGGYSLAKPIDGEFEVSLEDEESHKMDVNEGTISVTEGIVQDDENGDGEYVAMRTVEDDTQIHKHSSEIQLREKENDLDDIYTNVEIRRVQSMQVMSSLKDKNESEEHLPRRITSESKGLSSKPPKPQPRLSKKKDIDPYDYLPGIPIRGIPAGNAPGVNTIETTSNEGQRNSPGSRPLHEDNSETDGCSNASAEGGEDFSENISEANNLEAEEIYDYPRNQSHSFEQDDSIYKVPPSRYP